MGQSLSYNLTIGGRAKRFSAEDKLFKARIQESHMFSIINGTVLHMLGDVPSLAAHIFWFSNDEKV
jgi:hypothetical protein